ncbi:hypothetical protein M3Y99_00320200 [Aphelenchoides fujianensis]|nr:hypothetical protein M3Y99_00320200 [Aphelenchoides fujianensis]
MGNTDEYDYVIESCTFNSRLNFIDNFGCLRKDNVFIQKWETSQYTQRGALKRTLIHFLANEPIIHFECQVKIIHCGGCAEQSCERRPTYTYYPTYDMPLSCSYPVGPPPPPIPPGPPVYPPFGYQAGGGCSGWWSGGGITCVPWWLWLIFLILLLLLLCCLASGTIKWSSNGPTRRPPPPQERRIYTVDGAAQTLPDYKHVTEQMNAHDSITRTRFLNNPLPNGPYRDHVRQVDQHGSVDLRHEHPEANHEANGRLRQPPLLRRRLLRGGCARTSDYAIRISAFLSTIPIAPKYAGSAARSANQSTQQRLQRELEEHLRHQQHFQDRSEEFVERIEEQLRSQYHQPPHSGHGPEAFREETVRTMRQSSVI